MQMLRSCFLKIKELMPNGAEIGIHSWFGAPKAILAWRAFHAKETHAVEEERVVGFVANKVTNSN